MSSIELTPVQTFGCGVFVKRDDLYSVAGVCGGKVRACYNIVSKTRDLRGLVTAGSRSSPQVNIVASIAKHFKLPCFCHVPSGKLFPEVELAQSKGATIVQHKPGYNSVIVARARECAKEMNYTEIPFGMSSFDAVNSTRKQALNLKQFPIKRILMIVGSGMSLAGVLWGLQDEGMSIPITGVVVGSDPVKRLMGFAPFGWQQRVELIKSKHKYQDVVEGYLAGITLDPIYEAKLVPFIKEGDLVWIVGIRESVKNA